MKYMVFVGLIFALIVHVSQAHAWAESAHIRTYTNEFKRLTISGQVFSTARIRKFYDDRNYKSIWFDGAGPNRRLQIYLQFVRNSRVATSNQGLIRVIESLRGRMSNDVWVSIELLATESLLGYLSDIGIKNFSELSNVLNRDNAAFSSYLQNSSAGSVNPKVAVSHPAPPRAQIVTEIGSRDDIEKYVTKFETLKISGSMIETDQLRKLYGLRSNRSIWFIDGKKSGALAGMLSYVKYQKNTGTDVKEFWLPLASNASVNYQPNTWITIEILSTHVMLRYLNARGVSDYSELSNAIDQGNEQFMYYLRNLRAKGGIAKAQPVEEPLEGPVLRARPVGEALTDIAMPAAAIGASTSRFANDPVREDLVKFNELMPQRIFVDQSGRPNSLAGNLRDTLRSANRHGLNPNDYWSIQIEQSYTSGNIYFEQLARFAMLRYVNHIYGGRVDAQLIDSDLLRFQMRRFTDYQTLTTMLTSTNYNLKSSLDSLAPGIPQYKQLMRNLALLTTMKVRGTWRKIAQPKRDLRMGESSPVVAAVRVQLAYLGYLNTGNSEVFDESFDLVTKDYLKANGIPSKIDNRFWAAMDKSADERIEQVQVNLEKMRWIPRVNRDRFAFINTAAQEINLVENGQSLMKFRTVNGKAEKPTPSMLQQSKRVILNPTWTVPLRIAAEDKVALIRANPNYLAEHNMYVLQARSREYLDMTFLTNSGLANAQRQTSVEMFLQNFSETKSENAKILAMTNIQEQSRLLFNKFLGGFSLEPSQNKFYIVQGPGNTNALGVLKFPLQDMNGNPNSADIYMHDTNERNLFENAVRYNSSGCIRLQNPLEFAAELLKEKGWTINDIISRTPWADPTMVVTEADTQQSVTLDKPLLVYIVYLTSDQNEDGSVRFFDDHYGLDAKIVAALRASR